jgi:hypothetical protein
VHWLVQGFQWSLGALVFTAEAPGSMSHLHRMRMTVNRCDRVQEMLQGGMLIFESRGKAFKTGVAQQQRLGIFVYACSHPPWNSLVHWAPPQGFSTVNRQPAHAPMFSSTAATVPSLHCAHSRACNACLHPLRAPHHMRHASVFDRRFRLPAAVNPSTTWFPASNSQQRQQAMVHWCRRMAMVLT